jgi:Kef-type K+ transport system membrane component KefB
MAQGGAMGAVSFNNVLLIGLIAVAVPAACALLPGLPVPGAVLEVVAGIIVGPSVLGWVHVDAAVQVLSDLGLGMLLFLAGLEIDVTRLRGPLGRVAGMAFAVSAVLGLLCAYAFSLAGLGGKPRASPEGINALNHRPETQQSLSGTCGRVYSRR